MVRTMTKTTTLNEPPGGGATSPLDAYPESRLFFRIGDVAEIVGVKPYVLRYWESEFSQIAPNKSASGHRVYRREDVEALLQIKRLLHDERYSIEGARKRLKASATAPSLTPGEAALAPPVTSTDSAPSYHKEELLALVQELREAVSIPTDVIFR